VLVLFFSLQLISHIFLKLGLNKKTLPKSALLKISAKVFPFSAESQYEYAFALLEENKNQRGKDKVVRSIKPFENVILRNLLYFEAYFNLGLAYNYLQSLGQPFFNQALRYMKRAGLLRWNNLKVSMESMKFLLSFWPLLSETDKDFTRFLLIKTASMMHHDEIKILLEYWSLYCKDPEVFKEVLKKFPRHGKDVAEALIGLEKYQSERFSFMNLYEKNVFTGFRDHYRRFQIEKKLTLKNLVWMYRHMEQGIQGFYQLTSDTDFNDQSYLEFKKQLLLDIISGMLISINPDENNKKREKLEEYLFSFLKNFPDTESTKKMYKLLEGSQLFSNQGLKNIVIKLQLLFKMGEMDRVIKVVNSVKKAHSFLKPDQVNGYVETVLVKVEALIAKEQFDEALKELQELERIQPENMEIDWWRCKIMYEIGQNERQGDKGEWLGEDKETGARSQESEVRSQNTEDKIFRNDSLTQNPKLKTQPKDLEEYCDLVWNSRFINLTGLNHNKTVYFLDEPVIIININEAFKEKIKEKHLLQVFVDGWISFEQYLGEVKDEVKVEVKEGEWKMVKVEVRIR